MLIKWIVAESFRTGGVLAHSNFHQAPSICCTHAVGRVTSRAAGYDCVTNATDREGRVWLPKQHHLFATPRSRGVGTLRVCRPADYLPPRTVGQWPPATRQWWNERRGGDPKTDQVTQGLTHNSRAGGSSHFGSSHVFLSGVRVVEGFAALHSFVCFRPSSSHAETLGDFFTFERMW